MSRIEIEHTQHELAANLNEDANTDADNSTVYMILTQSRQIELKGKLMTAVLNFAARRRIAEDKKTDPTNKITKFKKNKQVYPSDDPRTYCASRPRKTIRQTHSDTR